MFENFGEFGTESLQGDDYQTLQPDAPAISIGLSMTVPSIQLKEKKSHSNPYNIYQTPKSNLSIEKNLMEIMKKAYTRQLLIIEI